MTETRRDRNGRLWRRMGTSSLWTLDIAGWIEELDAMPRDERLSLIWGRDERPCRNRRGDYA